MTHTLEKTTDGFTCTVCYQSWKHKPKSECPGLRLYAWDSAPDTLKRRDDLFGLGLKLAEGQQPAACMGTTWVPLYAVDQCVPHGSSLVFDEGKYKFVQTTEGFEIWRVCGRSVKVFYKDTYLCSIPASEGFMVAPGFGIYGYKSILSDVARYFAQQLGAADEDEAAAIIERALSYRFYRSWQAMVKNPEIVPADVEELARKMWASAQQDAAVLHDGALYTDAHKHTRADLLKYHACRMWAAFTQQDAEQVAQWREHLAPGGIPYKALNKTLDAMPTAVSWRFIPRLSTIALPKPITERLHLIFLLVASDHFNWGIHENVVKTADAAAVQEAGRIFGMTLTGRSRTTLIADLASSILDYNEPYGGDLVGLARRSKAWYDAMRHDNQRRWDEERKRSELPMDTALPMPEYIDLKFLEQKGITPLRTVQDCYDEHERMQHCVHTYASKAARGMCYLFHVEHTDKDGNKTQATVEVNPQGEVLQAKGPSNLRNAACEHGAKWLRRAWSPVDYGFYNGQIRPYMPGDAPYGVVID